MPIWSIVPNLERVNEVSHNTLIEYLGIEFLEIGDDYIKARLPVDHRTVQPAGLLHGGASAALAETLGSMASTMVIDLAKKRCVGLEINANHVRPVTAGYVYGVARPVHLGNSTHIWEIRITNEQDKLVCISRLTMAIIDAG
ncbi:MAG TPA: hotdog fold thioesterase [Anaerolineales bacterium]